MAHRHHHPALKELVGGLELGTLSLERRPDAGRLRELIHMLQNAEYWLSFDVAVFEPILAKSPSPLRELGVAVALRFGDGIDGGLASVDVARARDALLAKLPDDLRPGIELGLTTLARAVAAREQTAALEARGFRRYAAAQRLSVHALRAMGRSTIRILGHDDGLKRVEVPIGTELTLEAWDEQDRPLLAPEVESKVDAPIWSKDDPAAPNRRTIVILVPGEYAVRVPGRAAGDRKLVAI